MGKHVFANVRKEIKLGERRSSNTNRTSLRENVIAVSLVGLALSVST